MLSLAQPRGGTLTLKVILLMAAGKGGGEQLESNLPGQQHMRLSLQLQTPLIQSKAGSTQ